MHRVIKIEARPALPERDNVAPPRKKVAAYARVSTDQDAQQNSFEAQRDYYTKLITDNPDWEFAGIYAEEEHSYPVLYMDYPLSKRALLSLTVMSKHISWLRKAS